MTRAYEQQAEARRQAQQSAVPLSLYLGVNVEDFVVEDVTVSVDGNTGLSKQYSDVAAQALQEGGWDRLQSGAFSDLPLALRATVGGRFRSRRADETFTVKFDSRLPETSEPLSLVLLIEGVKKEIPTRETVAPIVAAETFPVAGDPRIYGDPGRPVAGTSQYVPGMEQDPRVRHARFLLGVGDAMGAAFSLMEAARYGAAQKQDSYQWVAASVKASLSMAQSVDAIFASVDTSARQAEYETVQLALATDALNAGRLKAAATRLERVGANGSGRLQDKANMLRARLALALGENERAVLALKAIPEKRRSLFAAYNLAVADIGAGQKHRGMEGLAEIGAFRGGDKAERALRDRANLALARHYFELGRRGDALRVVKTIPLQGPYASQALLATGWIVLADMEAEGQSDESLASLTRWLTGNASKASATPSRDDMHEALRYWDALVERDMADPTVQAGSLASAFVLEQLGLFEQALSRYRQTAAALWDTGRSLQSGLEDLRGTAFYTTIARTGDTKRLGRFWSMRGLPDVAASYWLPQALADARFQETFQDYRDLEMLASTVRAAHGESLVAAEVQLLQRAQAVGEACLETLRGNLIQEVRDRQRRVKKNLVRAHLAIARVTERLITNQRSGR